MKRSPYRRNIRAAGCRPARRAGPEGLDGARRSQHSASDPDAAGAIKFVTMGTGFHATNPQAAVYWNPANTATGNYTLKGTFTLHEAERPHELLRPRLRRQRSRGRRTRTTCTSWSRRTAPGSIKRRDGDASTQNVAAKAASDAVKKPDASGKSTNALEVRVTPTRSIISSTGRPSTRRPRPD